MTFFILDSRFIYSVVIKSSVGNPRSRAWGEDRGLPSTDDPGV